MTEITVNLDEVEIKTASALIKHGTKKWIADEVAKAVRVAEAEGNKICGLYYLESYCNQLKSGRVDGKADPEVKRVSGSSVYVDAKLGFAQPAFCKGLTLAVELAKNNGISLFSIGHSHTCTSMGYFTSQIARQGLIGIGTTNAPACVAPPGGNKPMLGTNPISMSVPTENNEIAFQFDQSTSAIAIGKIRVAAANGEQIPNGWAVDKDGCPTTNPEEALKGSLLSSGGYKGFGFGLMAEILASALTGSLSSVNAPPLKTTEGDPHDLGQTYILIDPNFNGQNDHFFEQLNNLADLISLQTNARLPGSNKNNPSEIEIDKDLWDLVNQLDASY